MPILVALDECLAVLVKISIYADLGLEDDHQARAALSAISRCCDEFDETIIDICKTLDR